LKFLSLSRHLSTKTIDEKKENILSHINHLRKLNTAFEHEAEIGDVLALRLFDCLPHRLHSEFFYGVRKDSDLKEPVAKWLADKGCKVYPEVLVGTNQADLVGYQEGGFLRGELLIGIELKNDFDQMKRAFDQLTTYDQFCDSIYLAATPLCCAQFVRWFSIRTGNLVTTALEDKLRKTGAGLLLVTESGVEVVQEATKERSRLRARLIEQLKVHPPFQFRA